MPRISVFIRPVINVSTMHPLPVADLKLPRGTDVTLQIQVLDVGNDKERYDLTGCEVEFIARKEKYPVDETEVLFIKTTENGVVIDEEAAGYLEISLTAEDLDLLPTYYWYDFNIITLTGEIIRQPRGRLILLP